MTVYDKSIFYNGNQNLRKAGIKLSMTQEQVIEYTKCMNDPIYFIRNYCKIITLDHGLQPFNLYPFQEKIINHFNENRKSLVMLGRQMGKTQTTAAYIAWYALFHKAKTVAILANKAAAAREVLDRVQTMIEGLPQWMQSGVVTWNKGDVEFENKSKIFTAATSSSGIRGKSVNLLYVDEAAFLTNTVAEQFFTSVFPTISAGKTTKVILSSTPCGYNHFWKFWNDAEEGANDFKPMYVHWSEHPERDEKWAEEQKRELGELKYRQEVLCNFLGSSATLIDPDKIGQLSAKKPMVRTKEGLDVYEEPKKGHSYILVADTSEGIGGDSSAFVVIDVSEFPYKMAAKFKNNKISPLVYPNIIFSIAKQYNEAFVLVEINKSEQVAYILFQELEYENLLTVNQGRKGQYIGSGFGANGQMGVKTTKSVKRIGCRMFKDMVEGDQLLLHDQDVISEISTFIERKNTYQADEGYHDDLVMCLVLFGWLANDPYFKDLQDSDLRSKILQQRIEDIEEELTPFGFMDDGTEDDHGFW